MQANAELAARAQGLAASKRWGEAEAVYRRLLSFVHVVDFEYDDWLKGVAECYRGLGRLREAGWIHLYLHQFDRAAEAFAGSPVELARVRELEALRAQGENARKLFLDAAAGYAEGGRQVHAAVAWAQAGDAKEECRAWERVLRDPRLQGHPYEEALVHFNLGLAAARDGDRDGSSRHLVHSQRLLEEVADEFELRGERHRAFDCYCILLKLGKDSGSFENLAEGYINCIRVLKEDNLKFYVLQYYEDFLRIALEREEYHAAATVCREAADYARRVGLIYDRGYMKRAAEIWWRAAEKNERDGGPVEITENAYLAAIDAFNSVGDFFHVRESYRKLGALALGDKKQKRYHDVVARYSEVWQEVIDAAPFPDYLRQQHLYPDIWHQDVIEWELDGEPEQVCASVIGDLRYADQMRRRALVALLTYLDLKAKPAVPGAPAELDPTGLEALIQALGAMESYAAMRPLERYFEHPSEDVRCAVMRALQRMFFKRTYVLLRRGLVDPSERVRDAALEAMRHLYFTHAFDPLTRIFRETDDGKIKEAALDSIGSIGSLEAGEFLIEVLRYEGDPLRDQARRLLAKFERPDEVLPILRKHLELENGPARQSLEAIVRSLSLRAPLS